MGRSLEQRKRLFQKFSGQLLLLKTNGLIGREFVYPDPYLCPVCLREFSEDHLDETKYANFLTAEDAPPDTLGGSKVALTCRECNNGCGVEIDWHLAEALRSVDDSRFYPGSTFNATTEFEGRKVTVVLEALGGGLLKAYHRIKHNNPVLLERFIYGIRNKTIGTILQIQPPVRRFLEERIIYALIKTNYILTFAKFGYLFLLDEHYQALRDQLRHPEQEIYPWRPFVKDQFTAAQAGTYYILNNGLKAIMNVFVLKTAYSDTVIAGFLQGPDTTMGEYADKIDGARNGQGAIHFENSLYDPAKDLFTDLAEMKKVINWIRKS